MSLILDLCGGTGSWSKPYREAGYEVIVVDPDAPEIAGCRVERADVRTWVPPARVHGILAAPPCTHLAGSGARWWKQKGEGALVEGLSVVDACLRIVWRLRPAWWALENPVGRLARYLGHAQLIFDPWEYGHPTIKRTCLWGEFRIPERTPVEPTRGQAVWRMGPSPDRARLRSITPPEFADAFFRANP